MSSPGGVSESWLLFLDVTKSKIDLWQEVDLKNTSHPSGAGSSISKEQETKQGMCSTPWAGTGGEGSSWDIPVQSERGEQIRGDVHVHVSILKVCEAAGWGSAHPSSCCRGSRALIPFFHTKIPAWEPALEGRATVTVTAEQLELENQPGLGGAGAEGLQREVQGLDAAATSTANPGRGKAPFPTSL